MDNGEYEENKEKLRWEINPTILEMLNFCNSIELIYFVKLDLFYFSCKLILSLFVIGPSYF